MYHYCKRKGISYWTMQTRCDVQGLTPDQALVKGPRQYTYRVTCNGEPLKLFCKREGLLYKSILDRAKRHKCTVEEAVKHFKERSNSKDGRANR